MLLVGEAVGAWRLLHAVVPAASLASCRQRINCENFDSAELVSAQPDMKPTNQFP